KTSGGRRTLQLKRPVDAGAARPGVAPGRGKTTVVVERKRKILRKDNAPRAGETPPVQTFDPSLLKRKPEAKPEVVATPQPAPVEDVSGGGLTEDEREARLRALEHAKKLEEELRRQEEENARRFA